MLFLRAEQMNYKDYNLFFPFNYYVLKNKKDVL